MSLGASLLSALPKHVVSSKAIELIQAKVGKVMSHIEENKENFLGIENKREGATPEIRAALITCVDEIFDVNEVDEATGTMRRDLIRQVLQAKLVGIDDAQLSNMEFDIFFNEVDVGK